MFNKFKFTIVMRCCENPEHLEKSILSIINQKMNFRRDVELILINNTDNEIINSMITYYQKEYPDNIVIITDYDKSCIELYNESLDYVKGKYLTFIDPKDYLSNNTLPVLYKSFAVEDVDIIKISKLFKSPLMKKFNQKYFKKETVNLLAQPDRIITSLNGVFFRTESISGQFNENLNSSVEVDFILNILLEKHQYLIHNIPVYYSNDKYQKAPSFINSEEYYTPRLLNFHQKLIDFCKEKYGYVLAYVQNTILHDLFYIIENNNLNILDKKASSEFIDTFTDIVKKISPNMIISSNYNQDIKSFLMYIRNDKKFSINKYNDDIELNSSSYIFENLNNQEIEVNTVYIEDNQLHIEAFFNTHFNQKDISLSVLSQTDEDNIILTSKNNFKIKKESVDYLNTKWLDKYFIDIVIPLSDRKISKNKFEIVYDDGITQLKVSPKINYRNTSNLYNIYSFKSKEGEYLIYKEDNAILTYSYKKINKKSPLFSIIIPAYNSEKYLKESTDSIINQTLNFERYVQLILVDDGSDDSSLEIMNELRKRYPNNVIVLSKKHEGNASARNLGLAYAIGKYVNFLDSDDYLSENALKEVNNLFKKHQKEVDVISLNVEFFEMDDTPHKLSYKFKGRRVLDIDKHPNYPQISVSSTFIKRNRIRDLTFNTDLICSEDSLFVNQILLRKKKILTTENATYYYRKRSSEDSIRDLAVNSKKYYTERLNNFHMNLINQCIDKYNYVPEFIQYMLAYDLNKLLDIYEIDVFDNEDEFNEFYNTLIEVLNHIDIDAIKRNRNVRGNNRNFLLYMRNQEEYHRKFVDDNIVLQQGDLKLESFNSKKIGIDIIEIKDGYLNIAGYFNTFFDKNTISINLVQESFDAKTEKIYESVLFNYPQVDRRTIKYLSVNWKYFHNFEFKLPLNTLINSNLTFLIKYDDGTYRAEYNPELGLRLPSGLSTTGIYMAKESAIVYFQGKSLKVIPKSYKSMLRLEVSVARKIFRDKQEGYVSIFFIRALYLILYPFMKNRKIWLFNDRPLIADDNGKHLFKYAVKQKDGIDKYYVLKRESDDFNEMKKIDKHIVAFGSLKHKMLFFFAQKHISAFVNEDFRNPFFIPGGNDHRRALAGLSTTQKYFLQHGVIFANVTRSLKKYNNNISLLLCSSDYERQSFFDWHYNYGEDVVTTLGLPRYDNLTTDDSKRQIVFMPTWRGNLKTENALFNSEFFKSLNSFINNEELHEFLKENDYKFVFKPHPELLKHLDKMELNENLEIALDVSYQDIFRDSSILITDYSSVAFDFAYLKKPLIYYQPNDDYPYEEGYLDFETMGFGDVIYTEEDMVKKIKSYITYGCVMEDKYKERVTHFFKYNDKNNCKRSYEWILNH